MAIATLLTPGFTHLHIGGATFNYSMGLYPMCLSAYSSPLCTLVVQPSATAWINVTSKLFMDCGTLLQLLQLALTSDSFCQSSVEDYPYKHSLQHKSHHRQFGLLKGPLVNSQAFNWAPYSSDSHQTEDN